ncbi:hypothetical protein EYF80_006171 [Liparis tanakae]|uniref:Uncharacterized protein n=1 Tax=Liparis tanakae TaxID=230148 RepID=A0A4Z2J2E7_9TELE|nr:hypothetical protein EYF80_006171 [Liparis tanakae]
MEADGSFTPARRAPRVDERRRDDDAARGAPAKTQKAPVENKSTRIGLHGHVRPGMALALQGKPLKTGAATFNPLRVGGRRSLPRFNPNAVERRPFNPAGIRGGRGSLSEKPPTLNPGRDRLTAQTRQSAQAKAQLISCHRERAPLNPRRANSAKGPNTQ